MPNREESHLRNMPPRTCMTSVYSCMCSSIDTDIDLRPAAPAGCICRVLKRLLALARMHVATPQQTH